ncbi:glycosyltransferase [Robertkochia marina]|uniref:Glycosyltransferase n=1 Tax=Robertkochia marina TaxID=1227945 RepID=A0A4S3M5Z9_9FLAO|nr:TIGR04283 family arsenosugar biosynthesis glycosyltransferase [Robertkochia marina]THD69811.1 glycosyltransferase [Robertkochia marina]TRZ46844.1 glycosyltransferase [Robertkochia marina]
MNNKISVIIPVLNEAEGIASLLKHLDDCITGNHIAEVIIADGGSSDGTPAFAGKFRARHFEMKVVHAPKGRAAQQNHGAKRAMGDILYFLHADSFPPEGFDQKIIHAVHSGYRAGCFRMEFDDDHVLLKCSQWFTQFNFPLCRGGDQSLFIKKDLFESLNGFNEAYVIYEDGEFHSRLYKQGIPFKILKPAITTSARRYRKNGFWRLQYHFTRVHLMHRLGHGPEALKNYYSKHIA